MMIYEDFLESKRTRVELKESYFNVAERNIRAAGEFGNVNELFTSPEK